MTTASPTSPPPPVITPARSPLRRAADPMLGGVCGGLAEHTGIDRLLWRIGFLALTLAGGAGAVLYAALWVLMPPAPADPARPARPVDTFVDRLHERVSGLL